MGTQRGPSMELTTTGVGLHRTQTLLTVHSHPLPLSVDILRRMRTPVRSPADSVSVPSPPCLCMTEKSWRDNGLGRAGEVRVSPGNGDASSDVPGSPFPVRGVGLLTHGEPGPCRVRSSSHVKRLDTGPFSCHNPTGSGWQRQRYPEIGVEDKNTQSVRSPCRHP